MHVKHVRRRRQRTKHGLKDFSLPLDSGLLAPRVMTGLALYHRSSLSSYLL